MIGYVTLGTNDLERAARFYDALAGEMSTSQAALAWVASTLCISSFSLA